MTDRHALSALYADEQTRQASGARVKTHQGKGGRKGKAEPPGNEENKAAEHSRAPNRAPRPAKATVKAACFPPLQLVPSKHSVPAPEPITLRATARLGASVEDSLDSPPLQHPCASVEDLVEPMSGLKLAQAEDARGAAESGQTPRSSLRSNGLASANVRCVQGLGATPGGSSAMSLSPSEAVPVFLTYAIVCNEHNSE